MHRRFKEISCQQEMTSLLIKQDSLKKIPLTFVAEYKASHPGQRDLQTVTIWSPFSTLYVFIFITSIDGKDARTSLSLYLIVT